VDAAGAGTTGREAAAGRLAGRVALVSGSARGQGAVEAARFLEAGAAGVVLGDVLVDELAGTAAALAAAHPGRVASCRLDVTEAADWDAAVALAAERFGGLHVLVNNAGVASAGQGLVDLEALDPAAWAFVLGVNLTGAFLGIRAAAPLIRATVAPEVAIDPRRSGSVVNVASAQGFRPSAGNGAYAASKWGLRGLTRVAALELAPVVRVNAVAPGPIATPMIADALDADQAGVLTRLVADLPLGRIGGPEEVADLVLYLASVESSYCTGADFVVDGGRVAGPARPPG